MEEKLEYLLRYISMETYKSILNSNNKYIINLLIDNAYNINLNIKYLINYGVTDITSVILQKSDDLIKENNDFIKEIENYEKKLSRREVIALFENAS